jgi:hypothetical protein
MSGAQEARREEAIKDAKAQFDADLAPYQSQLRELREELAENQAQGAEAKCVELKSKIEDALRKLDEVMEGTFYYKLMMKD